MSKLRNARRFAPSFDSLESRLALDGNVNVAFRHGLLSVVGDDLNNKISIVGTASGYITVSSLDGTTTINLEKDPLKFRGVTNGLTATLSGGADVLDITGLNVRKDLSINSGVGDDKVSIAKTIIGKTANILTLDGNDNIHVANCDFYQVLNLTTGAGDDQVTLSALRLKDDLNIVMNAGNDSLAMASVTANGNVTIKTLGGNDEVSILESRFAKRVDLFTHEQDDRISLVNSTFKQSLIVNSFTGNDTVLVDGVFASHAAQINAGAGDDVVMVFNSRFDRRLDLLAGEGNDIVALAASILGNNTMIDGQTGTDTLMAQETNIDHFTVQGFESMMEKLQPIATGDSASLRAGGAVLIDLAANDIAMVGKLDLSSITIVQEPAHGKIIVNDDGTVTYHHDGSAERTDSFSYTIGNSEGVESEAATVAIRLASDPWANDDTGSVDEGASAVFNIAADDQADVGRMLDLTSITITTQSINGNVTVNGDGTVTYTHNGSESLSDTFQYTIRDDLGSVSNVAVVNLTIRPQNDAPFVANDFFSLMQGSSLVLAILSNDSDAETRIMPSTLVITQQPAHGRVIVRSDGTVIYEHDGSSTEADSFQYTVEDSTGMLSNIGSVFLTINHL